MVPWLLLLLLLLVVAVVPVAAPVNTVGPARGRGGRWQHLHSVGGRVAAATSCRRPSSAAAVALLRMLLAIVMLLLLLLPGVVAAADAAPWHVRPQSAGHHDGALTLSLDEHLDLRMPLSPSFLFPEQLLFSELSLSLHKLDSLLHPF